MVQRFCRNVGMLAFRVGLALLWFLSYGFFGYTLGEIFVDWNPALISIITDVVFFGIGICFYRNLYRRVFVDEHGHYERFSAIWRSIFLFVLWVCVYLLGNIIAVFVPDPVMVEYQEMQASYIVWFTLLSFLVAPVVEEIMFRGVAYLLLRPSAGIWASAVFSSLIFGMLHGTVAQFFMGALFGIGQCFLFEYTHKLRWCIAMHVIVNIVSFGVACLSIPVDLFLSVPLIIFISVIAIWSFITLIPENRL